MTGKLHGFTSFITTGIVTSAIPTISIPPHLTSTTINFPTNFLLILFRLVHTQNFLIVITQLKRSLKAAARMDDRS